jgi:hypothetical protein
MPPSYLNWRLNCVFQSPFKGAISEAQNVLHPTQEPIGTPCSTAARNTEPLASVYKRACFEESQLSSKKQKHCPQKPSHSHSDSQLKPSHSHSQMRHLDSKEICEDFKEEDEGTDENLENGAIGARYNEAASPSCAGTASSVPRLRESESQSPILASLETGIYKFKTYSKQKFLSPNTASVATALSLLSRIPYH